MAKLQVKVQVYEFDKRNGHREGISKAQKPYSFYEQEAMILQSPEFRDCPTKLSFQNPEEILKAGVYTATVKFRMGRFSHEVELIEFQPVATPTAAAYKTASNG